MMIRLVSVDKLKRLFECLTMSLFTIIHSSCGVTVSCVVSLKSPVIKAAVFFPTAELLLKSFNFRIACLEKITRAPVQPGFD